MTVTLSSELATRRNPLRLTALAGLIVWLLTPPCADAHLCGDSVKELGRGLYLYTITADVEESEASAYQVIDGGDTNVIVIEPPQSFSSYNVGQFIIRTVNPGNTAVQFRWSYAPNMATGDCFANIVVSAPTNKTTAANYPFSQGALDPVNTFTGELVQHEEPDLDLGGRLRLMFARYYASGLHRASVLPEPLGPNWSHNFNARLIQAGALADVITPRGQRISFEKTGGVWQQTGLATMPYHLVEQGTNFVFGDPRSHRLETFDGAGHLIEIADEAGNTLTLSYAGEVLHQVTDGLGRTLTFEYEGFQKLASVSDGTRSVGFGYFGQFLSSFTNAAGKVTQYNYDFANPNPGLLSSRMLPRGNVPYIQQWDSLGRVTRQTMAGGDHYDFAYDGNTTWVTNPVGQPVQFVYNTNGALTAFTDATGMTATWEYDEAGLPSAVTDREGRSTMTTYDAASGLPDWLEHPDGRGFSIESVARTNATGVVFHHVSRITYDDGSFDLYLRDAAGNVTNWIDRAGRPIALTYNSAGQPLTATDAQGRTLFMSYNADGTLATYGLPAGSGFETTYSYDALKRKASVNRPDGTTLTFEYDALNHITQIKDEEDNLRTYVFNDNGYLETSVDAAGQTNLMSYDALDRLIGLTGPLGDTLGFAYRSSGTLAAVTNRLGQVTRYGYDAANRLVAITNAAGFAQLYTRNAEGSISAITDPLGAVTLIESLADGNVTRLTSPLTNTLSVAYNIFGSPIGLTNALGGGVRLRTLDPTDLVTREQVGGVADAFYTREASGLFDGIVDGIGGAWEYPRGLGAEVAQACDPLGRMITYTNDLRGRVVGMTFPGGLGTLQVSYSGLDKVTRLLYSDGVDLHYTNNPVGQLIGATGISQAFDAGRRMTNCNGLTLEWDAADSLTNLTFQPGRSIHYAYDARGLVTNITDWAGGGVSIQYDPVGRPVILRRANGVNTTNTWNAEGRLIEIQDGGLASISLVRDANGNVAQAVRDLPVSPIITADEKLWSHDIASQVIGQDYDALGRFLSDGERTCSWDLASRLTNIVWGTNEIVSTFDALNYRLTRTLNGSQASCVWNYALPLPTMCVVRVGGNDVRYFIYTSDGDLLYSIQAGSNARWYYHYDEAGNTTFLTDDAGDIIAAYAYSPFGEVLASTGSVANPFMWQGRNGAFREGDSGLYYLRARFYDSRTGRFLSRDTVHSMDPLRVNPYQYALNNPLRYIDPTGLDSIDSYAQHQGGVYSDGLLNFNNPIEIRGLPGSKFGLRDTRLIGLEFLADPVRNVELNLKVLSGLQFDANWGFSYTVKESRQAKISRLERELRDLGQSLPPQRRMSMGGGWNAQDPQWVTAGFYFGAIVDGLTQPADYSGGGTGGFQEDGVDPYSRLDELQRQLERCRRGEPPPVDISSFDLDFNYQPGGVRYDSSVRLSVHARYNF